MELAIVTAKLDVGVREGEESKLTWWIGLRMRKMGFSGVAQEFCFRHNTLVIFFNI